jgi:UDP-N-acetylglucosamine 4,6-dehydratase/5-epimerase
MQTILITGGTGSFGQACVRRLLEDPLLVRPGDVRRVIVYSRGEFAQSEMRRAFPDPRLEFFIGDVRDAARLRRAFETGPDLVIHAAALKQVPACEHDPLEAKKTNVDGAENIVNAAIDAGVRRVVALSTDKAAAPLNAYGKSKAMAESIFVRGNAYAGPRATRFSVVRYGNVIGSRGSIVPIFQEHQRTGRAIPITDTRMTRFWMPLEAAVDLVLYAAAAMQGGEIFVPEIPSAHVTDIAKLLAPACTLEEVGLRPGEKLHETLIAAEEAPQTVWRYKSDSSRVYVIQPVAPSWPYRPRGVPVGDDFAYRSDSLSALSRKLPAELGGAA